MVIDVSMYPLQGIPSTKSDNRGVDGVDWEAVMFTHERFMDFS